MLNPYSDLFTVVKDNLRKVTTSENIESEQCTNNDIILAAYKTDPAFKNTEAYKAAERAREAYTAAYSSSQQDEALSLPSELETERRTTYSALIAEQEKCVQSWDLFAVPIESITDAIIPKKRLRLPFSKKTLSDSDRNTALNLCRGMLMQTSIPEDMQPLNEYPEGLEGTAFRDEDFIYIPRAKLLQRGFKKEVLDAINPHCPITSSDGTIIKPVDGAPGQNVVATEEASLTPMIAESRAGGISF